MVFRVLFRVVAFFALLAVIVCASALNHFAFRGHAAAHAARQAAQAQHGLTGNYYISNWDKDEAPPQGPYAQVWRDPNDFGLPKIFTSPVATRVDAQVAFGQGKGFSARNPGPPVIWWPTASALPQGWTDKNVWNYFAAAVWKGCIHFPKAGTYYFGTLSNGGSAVYLNQARVALNGNYGGALVSDAFVYAKEDVQDLVQNLRGGNESVISQPDPRFQYIVPVSIDAPRDLPIEVRYNPSGHFTHWANEPFGIDLFWATPDSPRDPNGKPVATIVPSEALYTEAPGPIEKPIVRSANSTISADFLYFPSKSENFVTVTVRLADKDGNPVAGKRVSLSTAGATGQYRDEIVQPEKPTDAQGETSAKIRTNQVYPVGHDATIFATDVTDFVDVAQVGHVTFRNILGGSFFPDTFSPYYDPHAPEVTPLPLQVGREVTVKMPLVNRNNYAADVDVIFAMRSWNIGGFIDWREIGRVKNVRLQPGEHKDVSIKWTPDQSSNHICFRVGVNANKVAAATPAPQALSATLFAVPFQQGGNAQQGTQANGGVVQKNIGPVAPPPPCPEGAVPTVSGGHTVYSPWGLPGALNTPCTPSQEWKKIAAHARDRYDPIWVEQCTQAYENQIFGSTIDVLKYKYGGCARLAKAAADADAMAHDPADSSYRKLAAAASDTPPGYLDAWRRSWERYQAARNEGDVQWMAEHATAIQSYVQRLVAALRRDAEDLEKQASQLPPDDEKALAELKSREERLQEWLRKGAPLTQDQRKQLEAAGMSERQHQEIIRQLLVAPEKVHLKSDLALHREMAELYRSTAQEIGQLDTSPTAPELGGQSDQPLSQTYAVSNTHDREETVDLFIRPISIPADWKLSIVNAPEDQAGQQAGKPGGTPPKYPMHELDPGKHYNITLPAKTETKVASVVIPVGEIGARTTARWAVEGKIGNELIGGMVHEMNVPYIIPDLQLPPVGSKEVEEELPVPGRPWSRLIAEITAMIIVVGLLTFFFLFWRKRRRTTTET